MNAFAPNAHSAASADRVAAFFDLDGTLLPLPSLERRFLNTLRARRAIPAENYLLWLAQTIRLATNGINAVAHANKTYLRNVSVKQWDFLPSSTDTPVCAPVSENRTASAKATRDKFPAFFPDAIDRITWHAARRHAIVLVTGTLAPLASEAALALTLRLIARGITTSIAVCATQLEEVNHLWTGRIVGESMFGPAKVRAMRRLAAKNNFDLAQSYAYGDSTNDRWMLGGVGQPAAVNPSRELERIARLRNWPILSWKEHNPQHAGASAPCEQPTNCVSGKFVPRMKTESLG